MRLTKKQLYTLGAVCAVFLALLIFLGSCNRRLVSPAASAPEEETSAAQPAVQEPDTPAASEPVVSARTISTSMGDISVTETTAYEASLTYSRREYLSFDKSRIQSCRVEGKTRQAVLFTFQYQPLDATIHYFDTEANSWVSEPLSPGAYRANLVAIDFSSGASLFSYLPKTYNQK